ncbi:MAG: hypothetical protein ACRENJ_02135 [Candidatus Eiseniibacteriota bacterium]
MGRRKVAVLAEGRYPAGDHAVRWDASRVPGGAYLCRLEARGVDPGVTSRTRTLLVVR